MATNTPETAMSVTAPARSRTRTPLTERGAVVPRISSTALFHTTRTLGLANSRSCRMRSARKLSRRWMTVTLAACRVR